MIRLLSCLTLAGLLAACATTTPSSSSSSSSNTVAQATYQCGERLRLQVNFQPDAAHVTLPDGQTLILPQERMASGFAYANAQHALRGKGDEATWSIGRMTPYQCRAI